MVCSQEKNKFMIEQYPSGSLKFIIVSVILLACAGTVAGQEGPHRGSRVINDSTKQIYGPTTSHYYDEEGVFFNRKKLMDIDTAIRDFHRYTYYQRYQYTFQDLGNIGTAARPIFYRVPQYIGVNPGFESYDLYWEAGKIRYFDTKSPYSNLKVCLGGNGRSITNVTFARNVNPRWNFGFDYRGLFIDKQIQRQGKGDRNVKSNYYDFFTSFQSRDSTYSLFFNFARNRQLVDEYGGVLVGDDYNVSDFFEKNSRRTLTEAESRELRTSLHLFHQYEIGRALQIYHKFDRYRQGNDFIDTPGSEPANYYAYTEVDSAKTFDESAFVSMRNEVGVKGNLLKLFYDGYYAIRNFNVNYKYLNPDTLAVRTSGVEHYLGGRMELQLDSLVQLGGWVELMDNGNFRIEGQLKSRWLDAALKQNQYEPGFLQQAYRGSHNAWSNNFSPVNVTQLSGFLHYRSKGMDISPGMTFTRMNNYVFFNQDTSRVQDIIPVQASGGHVIFSPELRISLTFFDHLTLRTRAVYTSLIENSDDAIHVPDLFVNAQLAYENIFVHGNLDMQTGVEVHWQSSYDALGYDPAIQQFYVQDQRVAFRSPSFPLVDVFLNAKIKRGRIFIKYHNVVQLITKEGYFPTPYYPGKANVVDFGFDWSFYD
jgi:Putative porin